MPGVDQPGIDFFEIVDYLKFNFAWVVLPFYSEKGNVALASFNTLLQGICSGMTPEVFHISTNYYWGCIVVLNSGDDVEFNIHSEALGAIYNDNQK